MRILREMEQVGVKLDTDADQGDLRAGQGRGRRAGVRDLRAGGGGVHARLAQAAGGDPVRQARPVAQAPRQDRLLDRRPRAAGDPRRARDHPQDRALAGADQARPDLSRRAAAAGRRPTAACTPPSTRPRPPPAGCPPTTPTSRTSRSARRWAARSAPASSPTPGNLLVSADYSQVELRLLAHIAGEDVLKEIFRRGEDVHTATACRVFNVTPDQIDPGMRSKSKMINYGIVYGLSAYGMADRLDIPQEEAAEFIERYMAGFPAVGAVHRGDDRAGDRARLRLDPVRPPPPGARAARAALGAAQAGRALRGQHGDPGDGRGHHEDGHGPLRPGAQPRPG